MISQHSEVALVRALAERLFVQYVTSKEAREDLEDGGDPAALHEELAQRAWAAAATFQDMMPKRALGDEASSGGARRRARRAAWSDA